MSSPVPPFESFAVQTRRRLPSRTDGDGSEGEPLCKTRQRGASVRDLVHNDACSQRHPLEKVLHVVVDERKAPDRAARHRLAASMNAIPGIAESQRARAKLPDGRLHIFREFWWIGC